MAALTDFSADQREALSCVVDRLIPADADLGMPGAAEIVMDEHIDSVLAKNPGFDQSILEGLAALEELAVSHGASSFSALSDPDQTQALNDVSANHPGFLPGLIFHTYVGYYQDARVVARLGVESHPPFPGGFTLESGDLGLLDPVKERGKRWRDC
jgi:hypothetical protein